MSCYIEIALIYVFLDIEECAQGIDICPANTECTNTIVAPGFTCQCVNGYGGADCDGKKFL